MADLSKDGAAAADDDPFSGLSLLGIVIAATVCGLVLLILMVLTVLLLLRRSGCLHRGKLKVQKTNMVTQNNNLLDKQTPSISEVELQKLGKISNSHNNHPLELGREKRDHEDQVPLMLSDFPSPPDAMDKSLGESYNRNSWATRNTSFRLAQDDKANLIERLRKPNDSVEYNCQQQSHVVEAHSNYPTESTQRHRSIHLDEPKQNKPLSITSNQAMLSPETLSKPLGSPSFGAPPSPNTVIYQPTLISLAYGAASPKEEPFPIEHLEHEPKPFRHSKGEPKSSRQSKGKSKSAKVSQKKTRMSDEFDSPKSPVTNLHLTNSQSSEPDSKATADKNSNAQSHHDADAQSPLSFTTDARFQKQMSSDSQHHHGANRESDILTQPGFDLPCPQSFTTDITLEKQLGTSCQQFHSPSRESKLATVDHQTIKSVTTGSNQLPTTRSLQTTSPRRSDSKALSLANRQPSSPNTKSTIDPQVKQTDVESIERNMPLSPSEQQVQVLPARPNKLKIPPPTLPKPKFIPKYSSPSSGSNAGHYDVPRVHPMKVMPNAENSRPSTPNSTASTPVHNITARHSVSSSAASSPSIPPWERSSTRVAPWDRHSTSSPSRPTQPRFSPAFVADGELIKRQAQKSLSLQAYQRSDRPSAAAYNPNMRKTISEDSPSPLYYHQRPVQPKKVATVKPNSSIKHRSYQSFMEHFQDQYGITASSPSQGQIRVAPPTVDSIEEHKSKHLGNSHVRTQNKTP